MKAKEFIIEKLVKAGKKYRWMKYPMLALVSLVSLFFLLIEKCLEKPKRAVIALVCLVLIISQSWYLISMAGEDGDAFLTGNDGGVINLVGDGSDDASSENSGDASSENPDDASLENPDDASPENPDEGGTQTEPTITISAENMKAYTDANASLFATDITESGLATKPYILPTPTPREPDCYKFKQWKILGTNVVVEELTEDIFNQYRQLVSGKYYIYLSAEWERVGYKITYQDGAGKEVKVDYAPIKDSAAKLTLAGDNICTKTGSTYEQWIINGSYYDVNGTFTFGSDDVIAYPDWIGNKYYIDFQKGHEDATGEMKSMYIPYGRPTELNECKFEREGYSFGGWRIVSVDGVASGDDTIYPQFCPAENWSAMEDGHVVVEATWVYDHAAISYDGEPFVYSECANETAVVKHSTVGGGKFKITLTGVQGETLDGSVNKDNLREVTGLDVQCSMLDGGNAIELETVDSEGIRTVTTDDRGIVLSFMIEDINNPFDEDGNSTTVYLNMTVELVPKRLEVTGVGTTTKIYDGNAEIAVGDIIFTGAKPGDDIEVYSEDQSGYFSDPNAGTGKSITVNLSKYGEDTDYYTVDDQVTIPDIGSITKRTVGVTTAPVYPEGRDYFLTGEEPEYTVTINRDDLPEEVADADEGIILNAINGHYICSYKPNYQTGEFLIGIDNDVNLQNYSLDVTQGSLMVQQETPKEYIDYEITGNRQPGNIWYYGEEPCIKPTGTNDYDMVYITNDSASRALTYDSSKFKSEVYVTEDMCSENADLYIQLANSRTHAVTSMEYIEVYVDTTAPVIDSANIQISTVNTGTFGKIGNFLSFGNFFKESLMVTIPVSDNLSGAKTLTYYLDGNIWEDGIETTVRKDGTATFQIPIKYKGTIALTASDNAGNSSVLADLIGVEDSNYWVIENEAPEVRASAVDLDGNIAYSDENLYYKAVKMTASVTDQDAGVAYVIWSVTKDGEAITEDSKQVVEDTDSLLTSYDFERMFTDSGSYTVSVTAYDNADNESLPTEEFSFSVDGAGPKVQISPENYDTVWSTEKTVNFTVTDAESGVDMVTLRDENNRTYPYTVVQGKENSYSFTVTAKGTYTIKAVDLAGNVTEVPLEFTRVSSEVPETPTVVTNPAKPQNAESGWFTSNPEITISGADETPDGTKVTNYYRLWEDGTSEPTVSQSVTGSFNLPKEGSWNLRVWAVTESGVQSTSEGLYQIKYDGTAPEISDILIRGNGAAAQVSFKVTDSASGLAKLEAVYNNDESNAHSIAFDYAGNGVYIASFTASMKGSYTIKATDAAGNSDYADAFEPMNIVVTKITGSINEGIVVNGRVEGGTFAIDSLTVKYGLTGQTLSKDADSLIVTTDKNGDKVFTAKFTQLNDDSRYDFLITAFAESGESCNYSGSFKTGIREEAGVNIAGTVLDETMDKDDTTAISVVLYGGNDIIQIQNVQNNEAFLFTNVPDGAYTIRAINGNRSVSKGIVICDNTIVEPTDAIRLILRNGKSTSVEYGNSDTKQVSVSGLENIFDDTTNFGSDLDYSIINTGGMVEFCMEITELSEGEIPANDMALITRNLKNNERVASYMDFSIWKRRIGAFGIISETQVTSISGGKAVRIVIPLSDELIASEGVSVLRVHDGAVERLSDLDSNPNTYTIESTLFSTYALVYTDNSISNNGNNNNNNNSGGNGGSANITDISKTPNTNISITKSSSGTSVSPKTGDETPIVLISILSIIMGFCGILFIKNKKRQ